MMPKNITLEMSLKPFTSIEPAFVRAVCRELFEQWNPLLKEIDGIRVLLWTSDGSEILDYTGNLAEEMEWARYIGGANPRDYWDRRNDPQGIGLHTKYYLYCEDPPKVTFGDYRDIIAAIKAVGQQVTGKPVLVGATFDPGPEFARSPFKYERHPEILMGHAMGKASFVCCYGVLHSDDRAYAGFPQGIPEGTPFGTFLGRQCRRFLADMGLDYIWFSNGLGFGSETWGTTGALFDGKAFYPEKTEETRRRIQEFWRLFRDECDVPVETRGTNLTFGIDFSTDAVDLKSIYEGGFGLLPPPNSPWAALDGDFGLELAGYLSRVAKLPGEDFLFRFYIHDPWWVNSPWMDRYEGQPHDIYLPLATSRVDEQGRTRSPNHLNFLTVDDSFGRMPRQVVHEVIPHLTRAYAEAPDAPAPFLWVYPFNEYADNLAGRLEKPFFEDWYLRGAINQGLPVASVAASDVFCATLVAAPQLYRHSIVVTPVPSAGSLMNQALADFVRGGGQAIVYGSVTGAEVGTLELLNLAQAQALQGELTLELSCELAQRLDPLERGTHAMTVLHDPLMSDGGVDTVLRAQDGSTAVLVTVAKGDQTRVAALQRRAVDWQGGAVVWLRGTNASSMGGGHILTPHDPRQLFPAESLMRLCADLLGYRIAFEKPAVESRSPVVLLHRHENAVVFSGYCPDTTVGVALRLPLGAPLLLGWEAQLRDGVARYRLPRAWRAQCRSFVEQQDGVLSYREIAPVSFQMRRRRQIAGLQNATVRVLLRTGYEQRTELLLNSVYPHMVGEPLQVVAVDTPLGPALEARGVTGTLTISERDATDEGRTL